MIDAEKIADDQVRAHLSVVLLVLTAVTGLVDAVSYLRLGHIFTANMTGNVVLLGFSLGGAGSVSIAGSLTSLGAFLVGALVGGRLARRFEQRQHRWLTLVLLGETLLLALGAALVLARSDAWSYGVIVALASSMGLQNSTARRLSIPDLTTTVLTLTLTGLAADTQFPGPTWVLVRRRLIVVATMLLGALLGALLLHWSVAAPLVIGAALVAMLTLSYLFVWRTVEQRTEKRGASSAEEDGRNSSRDGMA